MKLTTNAIKKEFYKEKTMARFFAINKGIAMYKAYVGYLEEGTDTMIVFSIPISDMGDAWFLPEMEAKHLIRWLPKE